MKERKNRSNLLLDIFLLIILVFSLFLILKPYKLEEYRKSLPKGLEISIDGEMKQIDFDTRNKNKQFAREFEGLLNYDSWRMDNKIKLSQEKLAPSASISYGRSKIIWIYPNIDNKVYFSVGGERDEMYSAPTRIWRAISQYARDFKDEDDEVDEQKPSVQNDNQNDLTEEALNKKLNDLIYQDILQGLIDDKNNNNFVPVILIDLIDVVKNDELIKAYVNSYQVMYSFKDGIFKEESGAVLPQRYDFNKNLEIIEIHNAMDGSYFAKSILDMANGDASLAQKLMDSQNSMAKYNDEMMEELKNKALEMGFENVSHKLEEIPGYEDDVTYVENDRYNSNIITLIKTKDYEALQEERKTIVPDDQAGKHWVYRPCVLYHKNTGICVESILDYFTKAPENPEENDNIISKSKIVRLLPNQNTIFLYSLDEDKPLGDFYYINLSDSQISRDDEPANFSDLEVGQVLEVNFDISSKLPEKSPPTLTKANVRILPTPKQNTESKELLGKIFIQGSEGKVSIHSESIQFKLIEMLSLEYDKEKDLLLESDVLNQEFFIKDGQTVTYDVLYDEDLPSRKLKWVLEDGSLGEYILTYENGQYPNKEILYYTNGEVVEKESN